MQSTMKSNYASEVTYDMFKASHAIYCFTFGEPPGAEDDHVRPLRKASARLDAQFETGSNNPALTMLVYFENPAMLTISSNRTVTRDYIQ